MELYPYQKKAVENIHSYFKKHQRILLVMATGTGKTIVFSRIAKDFVENRQRVLVLVHRKELIDQTRDKLARFYGLSSSIEKAAERADESSDVVIGSLQTVSRPDRLNVFPEDAFGLIIVDEAHYAPQLYSEVLRHFRGAKALGVTATPSRSDGQDIRRVFHPTAFSYLLRQGIHDKYLVPIRLEKVALDIDIMNALKPNAADFDDNLLAKAIDPYLVNIARIMKEWCAHRKTLVFLPTIELANRFHRMLQANGFSSAVISSKTPNRTETIRQFRDGIYNVICNVSILIEGFDEPSVDSIVILRPTLSLSRFEQMIGRGIRRCEGKTDLLFLDFLWLSDRKDLCHPEDLYIQDGAFGNRLGKIDRQIADEVRKTIRQSKETSIRVEKAIEDALQRRLEEHMVDKPSSLLLRKISYEIGKPYLPLVSISYKGKVKKAQRYWLASCGLPSRAFPNYGLASAFLTALRDRMNAGLSSYPQIQFLQGKLHFQNVASWTFGEAMRLVEILRENFWEIPDGINPETFIPDCLNNIPSPPYCDARMISLEVASGEGDGFVYALHSNGGYEFYLMLALADFCVSYTGDIPVLLYTPDITERQKLCLDRSFWLDGSEECFQGLMQAVGEFCGVIQKEPRRLLWGCPVTNAYNESPSILKSRPRYAPGALA